jgi:hypothetical protein
VDIWNEGKKTRWHFRNLSESFVYFFSHQWFERTEGKKQTFTLTNPFIYLIHFPFLIFHYRNLVSISPSKLTNIVSISVPIGIPVPNLSSKLTIYRFNLNSNHQRHNFRFRLSNQHLLLKMKP